jgi:glycosyltransferase involved in cell wall biosynthesis
MFISTIIPTVGRPSLARAVESVLAQRLDEAEFEVIVVNDSGGPLPEETWQQSARLRIVASNRRERSVARNTGAAMARGQYLHFLDDDDWLAPEAFSYFWRDRPGQEVGWYYGVSQLVDRRGAPTIQLHHGLKGNCFLPVMAGEWIPLQSSLISSDAFFAAGGFNPLLSGPEDIDLLRRMTLHYEVASTDGLIAFVGMGDEGSTTDYTRHPQLRRWAREEILEQAEAFSRLRHLADDANWKGRLLRIYLTSMMWNVRRLRLFRAAARAANVWRGVVLGGRDLFRPAFWRSIMTPYDSPAFSRGLAMSAAAGADRPGAAARASTANG